MISIEERERRIGERLDREISALFDPDNKQPVPHVRRCPTCKDELPVGRVPRYCHGCNSLRARAYYQANRERRLATNAAWNKRNPYLVREARRAYYHRQCAIKFGATDPQTKP